jgi:magnesium transporter
MAVMGFEAETELSRWSELSEEERIETFRRMAPRQADSLFLELSSRDEVEILLGLPASERRIWMRLLAPDDAADVIQLAPEEKRGPLLSLLDDVTRAEVTALLAYKEDEAGGLMSPRFARLRPEMTVDEAIAYLRRQATQVESVSYAYVLDDSQRLLGVLNFRDLFAAESDRTVRELMRTDFIYATEEMDQEAVARLFSTHRLLAIPVLDEQGRMQGIVTADDIADVVREEDTEDIQKFGGMEALDAPYFEIGFWNMVRKRAGWLAILFIGEMLTASAMGHFESEIERAVVLALFVPLIISSGGNSGSQATTLVIRAMAIGELRPRDWWRILYREAPTGFVLGCILALIGMTRVLLWQAAWSSYGEHYLLVALTVGASLIGVVLFGSLAGSMLPLVLRRLGLDPASASAPFVATMVDVTGLVIYFTIASVIMRGVLEARP